VRRLTIHDVCGVCSLCHQDAGRCSLLLGPFCPRAMRPNEPATMRRKCTAGQRDVHQRPLAYVLKKRKRTHGAPPARRIHATISSSRGRGVATKGTRKLRASSLVNPSAGCVILLSFVASCQLSLHVNMKGWV
jgi:hypothetical protein